MPAVPSKSHTVFFASLRVRLLALALCCLLPALVIVAGIGIIQNRYQHDAGGWAIFAMLFICGLALTGAWVASDLAAALRRREQEIRLTERSMAEVERRLMVQQAVTKILADSASISAAVTPALASIGEGFGWDVGILWQVDADSDTLRCAGAWADPHVNADDLIERSRGITFARGDSGPGRVWASGEPYAGGIASGPVGRMEAAALAGLRSTLAIPVPGGTEVVGVLELFSLATRSEDGPLESLSVLARLLGESIVRRKGETTQARLLGILEMTTDLVGFASPEGRILYVNRAGRAMVGIGENEDVTRTLISDFYDEENARFVAEVTIPVAIQHGVWVGEETMRHRNGRSVRVSAVAMAHRASPGGQVEYVSIIARDITEKVRLEEQLRQSQKMEAIGSLAGGIAHDFNNLLTAIQGFSDLALTRLGNPEALKRDLEEVRRASVRAAALTRQLLIFSRQEILEPRPVSMNLLVTELGKMLRRLIGEDIELTMTCEEPGAMILADPGQIEQVIINLVVNARDAMPEGGQLSIETSRTEIDTAYAAIRPGLKAGSYVLLSVSDTGTGMDADTQARIFEPFFTTKEPGKGTGLGLATVYGIVKQCEGDIQVLSEPGQGTTFNILLPRLNEPAPVGSRNGESAPTGAGTETILVVEDEEAVRALIRSSLSLCGYRVYEARDGNEAMAVQAEIPGPIHLAICDMVMPGMNGPEVAARLLRERPQTKVLFMSGYAEKSVLRRGIAQGAFLHKPFGVETLARKVREVLDAAQKATVA